MEKQSDTPIRLTVKVIPRASRNEVVERDGKVVVRVAAVPTDGKANAAVVELVAEYFDVPKSRVSIVRGAAARLKSIVIV